MRRLILATALVLAAGIATAKEMPRYFEGVRPLGMGGAFTAVADDENALFYNPAGLDRIDRWGMGVLNPLVEFGENSYDFYRDASDIDFDVTTEVTDLLRTYIGKSLHLRAALFPHFVMRHFGVGVLGQGTANLEPHNVANPEIDVDVTTSVGGHAGIGWGFLDDKLRVGGALKFIRAGLLKETYTAEQIASDDFQDRIDDDRKDGSGFGVDLGAMYTFPVFLEPTVAVVVQNISDVDLGDAGEIPQQINLGVSGQYVFSWLTVVGAADWRDVTTNVGTDDDLAKRLHFGLEGRLKKYLSVRTGLYQGYGSFGATLDFRLLQLDYATYAEEIGSSAGDEADRRHVLQVTLGW